MDEAAAKNTQGSNPIAPQASTENKTAGTVAPAPAPSRETKTVNVAPGAKPGSGRVSSGSARTATRPSVNSARRSATVAPVPPSKAKTVVILICVALFVACLGVGAYIAFLKPAKKPATTTSETLNPEARALVDKAAQAQKLYDESIAKGKSNKLEDLNEAVNKMSEAIQIWTAVANTNQTVEGFGEQIALAHNKLPVVDKELRALRERQTDAEMAQMRENVKKTDAAKKSTEAAVQKAAPKPDDLSDANINRLITDDPSEAERLIKLRQKQDPTYKPSQQP